MAADETGDELREGMDCSVDTEAVLDGRRRNGKAKDGRR